jgi:D-glycero-alpha-D-manno-heptose-7-phosphate kinase
MIKARAPLRIGLAGGGTDFPAYADVHGGAVLSATISRYVYASIEPRTDGLVWFGSADTGDSWLGEPGDLPDNENLRLHVGVYARMSRHTPPAVSVLTHSDVQVGSGLGASSAMTVALVHAFARYLNQPTDRAGIAPLARSIERHDLGLPGGAQDHYSATYGGINFIEFARDRVAVTPVAIAPHAFAELESSLMLYNSGVSRKPCKPVSKAARETAESPETAMRPLAGLKREAFAMHDALVRGRLDEVADSLRRSWTLKKATAPATTNPAVEAVIDTALAEGASAAKTCGAPGSGHIAILIDVRQRARLQRRISAEFPGTLRPCSLESRGSQAWTS